jgi:hypothetical protein
MKLLWWRITAKREPRYPSYTQFQALSEIVQSLSDAIIDLNKREEATRKKIYREEKKTSEEEAAEILGGNGKMPVQAAIPSSPGAILTPDQINQLLGGSNG